MANNSNVKSERIGLCSDCLYMRQIKSDRGSTFYQCERSASNPEFPKYPRLPVIQCPGYDRNTGKSKH
jgi:hypothetical protein